MDEYFQKESCQACFTLSTIRRFVHQHSVPSRTTSVARYPHHICAIHSRLVLQVTPHPFDFGLLFICVDYNVWGGEFARFIQLANSKEQIANSKEGREPTNLPYRGGWVFHILEILYEFYDKKKLLKKYKKSRASNFVFTSNCWQGDQKQKTCSQKIE